MDEQTTTVDPHEFMCPFCNDDLGEETLCELMGEPFNGISHVCACGAKLTMSVGVHIHAYKSEGG